MGIMDHLQEYHGLPVVDFPESVKDPHDAAGLPAPGAVTWRITVEPYSGPELWTETFTRFLTTIDSSRVRALIVGCWEDIHDTGPEEVIEALVAAHDRLPALRALFLADIVAEQCEISHINQGEVTPLLNAFTELEEFGVRGGWQLSFPAVRHERLRRLLVESGGLPAEVVRGVADSDLPALEHLDLWLGRREYGGDCEVADLAPILAGTRLPALKHLALHNSEIQDDICTALAAAPVVARLDELSVSMGTLTDDGAAALLTGQPLTHLTTLDLHHNFLSDEMRTRLKESLEAAGVHVDTDAGEAYAYEPGDGTVRRYVAVGE
ncbi:STM4015 family protein [Streptomyces sp. NPDC007983]|uniref:STM4015 family protein n=1 Tax=Streptomyces sp. NPDC007983 TaxID=3364800 RepID=UPI0036E7BC03